MTSSKSPLTWLSHFIQIQSIKFSCCCYYLSPQMNAFIIWGDSFSPLHLLQVCIVSQWSPCQSGSALAPDGHSHSKSTASFLCAAYRFKWKQVANPNKHHVKEPSKQTRISAQHDTIGQKTTGALVLLTSQGVQRRKWGVRVCRHMHTLICAWVNIWVTNHVCACDSIQDIYLVNECYRCYYRPCTVLYAILKVR